MTYRYSGRVPSELSKVCAHVKEICAHIKAHTDIPQENLQDLRLILSELMINGCEHGNANDLEKMVFIDITVDGSMISIVVKDEGDGVLWDIDSCRKKNLTSSGRGLRIVHALAEKLLVKKTEVHCLYRIPSHRS